MGLMSGGVPPAAPGGGLATETTLASILSEVTGVSADASVLLVRDAITAQGDGKTIKDVVDAIVAGLGDKATEATAADILAELQAQGIDVAAAASSLAGIDANTDDLETIATGTNTKLEEIRALLAQMPADPLFMAEFTGTIAGRTAHSVLILGRRTSFPSANVLTAVVGYGAASTMPAIMDGTEALEVVSSDANDTALGSGVRSVKITYIDALSSPVGQETTIEVNLSGTSPVALGAGVRALCVNWFCGENTSNRNAVAAGNIIIRKVGTGTEYASILAGGNRSQDAIYMVPKGHTLFLRRWNGSVTAAATGTIGRWRPRATVSCSPPHVLTTVYHFISEAETPAGQSTGDRDLTWTPLPEGALIMLAVSPSATASFTANGSVDGVLIANA